MSPKELADHASAGVTLKSLGYVSNTCTACKGTGMFAPVARITRLAKDGSDDGEFEMPSHCNFCGGTGLFWRLPEERPMPSFAIPPKPVFEHGYDINAAIK